MNEGEKRFVPRYRGDDKAAQEIAKLRETHRQRGTLGVFYALYPDLAPPGYWRAISNDGRER